LAQGGWVAYRGRGRPRRLTGLEEWVAERFRRHAGNADVVRQELEREKGIRLSLRTVEREVGRVSEGIEPCQHATSMSSDRTGPPPPYNFALTTAAVRTADGSRLGLGASDSNICTPIRDDTEGEGYSATLI
jgi:hypothetical protein